MEENMPSVLMYIILPVAGLVLGWTIRWLYARFQLSASEQRAERVKQDAIKEAEAQKKEILLEAKDQLIRERNQQERENRERRSELQRYERRLTVKEETLDKRMATLDAQEQDFVAREQQISEKEANLATQEEKYRQELERISGLTAQEAKNLIIQNFLKVPLDKYRCPWYDACKLNRLDRGAVIHQYPSTRPGSRRRRKGRPPKWLCPMS